MLTDYHVHLRPDEPGTTAELFFTTANAERYRAAASERGIAELGVSEHVYRFEQALDVWRHPFWQANAREDLDGYCEFVREQTDLKLGIEAISTT
jgi:histidinol-phosphatase (PHP family)